MCKEKKNKPWPRFHILYQINSKWMIDVNAKHKALELLKKTWEKIFLGFS